MKRHFLLFTFLFIGILSNAQEISPIKTDASDYVPMLNDAGFSVYDLLAFELSRIRINAVTPLVLLGSYWYDETFKRVCFYGDEGQIQSPSNTVIPMTGGKSDNI